MKRFIYFFRNQFNYAICYVAMMLFITTYKLKTYIITLVILYFNNSNIIHWYSIIISWDADSPLYLHIFRYGLHLISIWIHSIFIWFCSQRWYVSYFAHHKSYEFQLECKIILAMWFGSPCNESWI